MAGVNKVIILGRLGRDPEVRTFQNGGMIVTLRVATSETWRDKSSGERKERTEWHSVSITAEHTAKIAEQYLRKGSKVYIEGQLETRKWQDQSGADRYTTEVVVRPYRGTLQLLDGKRGENGEGYSSGASGDGGAGKYDNPDYDPNAGGQGYGGGIVDDEIPF